MEHPRLLKTTERKSNAEEHEKILKQGVEAWNRWREANPDVEPDLSRVALEPDTFRDTPLWNAEKEKIDLRGANFENTSFELAKLRSVRMNGCPMKKVSFLGAQLIDVSMSGADLEQASFARAYLENVKMIEARLDQAIFRMAQLKKVRLDNSDLHHTNFVHVKLQKVNLTQSRLDHAILDEAKVKKCDFSHASMQRVEMRKALFEDARVKDADMTGANLENATFSDVKLARTILEEGRLNGVNFRDASLKETRMTGANLKGADLRNTDLRWADMRDTNVAKVRYNRWSKYQGIRLDGSYSSPAFVRFAKDQEFIEEVRGERHDLHYWLIYVPWLVSSDCGRSLGLWAGWSVLIATVFAYKFWLMGPEHFSVGQLEFSLRTMIYFSVVTFTTLGYGDILPKTDAAAAWVVAEVVIGYMMLGGLIAIFSNKLARRA